MRQRLASRLMIEATNPGPRNLFVVLSLEKKVLHWLGYPLFLTNLVGSNHELWRFPTIFLLIFTPNFGKWSPLFDFECQYRSMYVHKAWEYCTYLCFPSLVCKCPGWPRRRDPGRAGTCSTRSQPPRPAAAPSPAPCSSASGTPGCTPSFLLPRAAPLHYHDFSTSS